MILIALLAACASPPAALAPAPPTVAPPDVENMVTRFAPVGPLPDETTCTFPDGTQATIAFVTRWPDTVDFTLGAKTVRVDPETPGWKPYEYTGNVYYAWSLAFDVLDASWLVSVETLAPEEGRPRLARTRAGVTDMAECG